VSSAITITRVDYTAGELRSFAANSAPAPIRRLLAIAMVLEGSSRFDAARRAGMGRQTLRDWMHRYNADGIEGLVSGKAPGQPRSWPRRKWPSCARWLMLVPIPRYTR
jgi:hypothetical protein